MSLLSRAWELWGRVTYRLAGSVSGRVLGLSGCLESVLVHRSVATGEVRFGQSDLDLVLVLRPQATNGSRLAGLLRLVRWLQFLNPAMLHREVYPPGGLEDFGSRDTVWASIERRTLLRVYGQDARPPLLPINRDHATRRLLVWWETFFTTALARRHPRNLEKACLECWNFFAVAQGLLSEPLLRRSDMKSHMLQSGHPPPSSLREPEGARRFLLDLIARLHRDRRRPLARLAAPFVFETTLAPHCQHRRFLVLPSADSPLPPEYIAGDLVATPELLDLFMHSKNAFMHWSLPKEMAELGMSAPSSTAFRRDAHYTCAANFLFFPGFGDRVSVHPRVRLNCVRHALECLRRGDYPTALGQEPWLIGDARAYYLEEYDALELERSELARELAGFDGP